jgi:hypothetical protein
MKTAFYAGQCVAYDQAYKGPGRGYVIVAPGTREYRLVFQDPQFHQMGMEWRVANTIRTYLSYVVNHMPTLSAPST